MKKYNIASLILPTSYIAIIFIYLKLMFAYAYMHLMHPHPVILMWLSGLLTDFAFIFLSYVVVDIWIKKWKVTTLIKVAVLVALLIIYAYLTMPHFDFVTSNSCCALVNI